MHRFFRKDRAVMFDLAAKLELVATSSDASVLAALEHARAYHAMRRDHIPLPPPAGGEDAESGLAFASGNWRHAVPDRRHMSPFQPTAGSSDQRVRRGPAISRRPPEKSCSLSEPFGSPAP